jgi:hypothetical protein
MLLKMDCSAQTFRMAGMLLGTAASAAFARRPSRREKTAISPSRSWRPAPGLASIIRNWQAVWPAQSCSVPVAHLDGVAALVAADVLVA